MTDHDSAILREEEDDIPLIEMANTLLRNWRVVAVLPVLLALVAIAWSLARAPTYVVSASFMLQATEPRGPAGAAALAQQFGVNLSADRPGQSPQFYVDLLQSTTLLRQAVETEYQVPTEDGRVWRGTLVQYWGLDGRAGPIPPWRRATEILSEKMTSSVSQETGVVGVTIASDNPVLAELIAERLLGLLNDFNLGVRQSRAQEESRFISGRVTEAEAEQASAESALQAFLQHNRAFRNSPELTFEHDRLQRHVMMRQELYTSLLRSQDQARIDAVRDIPLLTVIDHPAGTAELQRRKVVLRAVLALMLGLILAVFVSFVAEFARRSRETADPHYREFQGLARQAWNDLRHPGRWLRRGEKRVVVADH